MANLCGNQIYPKAKANFMTGVFNLYDDVDNVFVALVSNGYTPLATDAVIGDIPVALIVGAGQRLVGNWGPIPNYVTPPYSVNFRSSPNVPQTFIAVPAVSGGIGYFVLYDNASGNLICFFDHSLNAADAPVPINIVPDGGNIVITFHANGVFGSDGIPCGE